MAMQGRRSRGWGGAACLVAAVAGCSSESQETANEPGPDAVSSERPVTETPHGDRRLAQQMERIAAVPADSIVYLVPVHLEEVGAILDELEPMSLGMQSDTVWRSTVDSVQNDLALMRDMNAEQLTAFMPEHGRRIERLIMLHDSAMGTEP